MKRIARIVSAIALCVLVAGCGKPGGTGAAITSTVVDRESGKVTTATLYGYSGGNDRIEFAIFTNIRSEDAISSVAGSWRGRVAKKGEGGKPVLVFTGSPEAIEINGTRYEYTAGRVFLAAYLDGKLTVNQIDLPIMDAGQPGGIARLGEQKEVRDFLRQ